MILFFEIFPKITYIYDHTMSNDIYKVLTAKIKEVIKLKTLPTEDICRMFNILVENIAYSKDQSTLDELTSRLRSNLFGIP